MLQTNVLEYLEGSALRFENKVAFADDKESVTFGQMRRQAMGLGTCLAADGGPVNRPVAVLIDRTACSLTAMQGVLYSGNYYVPIDNKMPVLRARNILQQVDFS